MTICPGVRGVLCHPWGWGRDVRVILVAQHRLAMLHHSPASTNHTHKCAKISPIYRMSHTSTANVMSCLRATSGDCKHAVGTHPTSLTAFSINSCESLFGYRVAQHSTGKAQ